MEIIGDGQEADYAYNLAYNPEIVLVEHLITPIRDFILGT